MNIIIFIAFILLQLVLYVIGYNYLRRLKNNVQEAWSNTFTSLQKRHAVLPQLVVSLGGAQDFETLIQASATAARSGIITDTATSEQQIQKGIFALKEAYPTVTTMDNTKQLMDSLRTIEDDIQGYRLIYNRAVADYRRACDTFPLNLVAYSLLSSRPDFFELAPSDNHALESATSSAS